MIGAFHRSSASWWSAPAAGLLLLKIYVCPQGGACRRSVPAHEAVSPEWFLTPPTPVPALAHERFRLLLPCLVLGLRLLILYLRSPMRGCTFYFRACSQISASCSCCCACLQGAASSTFTLVLGSMTPIPASALTHEGLHLLLFIGAVHKYFYHDGCDLFQYLPTGTEFLFQRLPMGLRMFMYICGCLRGSILFPCLP